jgi:hypothetical protein
VGAVSRTAPVSGQQIADRLVRRVGRQPGTIPATDAIDKSLKQVSREMFQPLEREFTEVTSPGVLAAIQSDDPLVNAVIRRSLPKAVRQGERPPSLLELQSLRQRLRGKASAAQRVGDPAERRLFSDAEAQLREALTDEIPGFAEAQSRWAALQASKRAIARGERLFNARPETMTRALRELPDDAARDHFRLGVLTRWHDRLSQRFTMTRSSLEKLQSMGVSGRLRLMFSDDANGDRAFRAFMQDIEHAGRAVADVNNMVSGRQLAKSLLAGFGIGAGGALGFSIF